MKIEINTYRQIGDYTIASVKQVDVKQIDARGSKRGERVARSQAKLERIEDDFSRIARTCNGDNIKTYYERIEAKSTKQRNSRKAKRAAR